ncbi:MAG: galactokinase [Terriglobales bacterium]
MKRPEKLAELFEYTFGTMPSVYHAPGRVNLIGEHTDYNDGFVMPCAIDLSTQVAISGRNDKQLVVGSAEFSESFQFDVDRLPEQKVGAWCDYVLGVATLLRQGGYLKTGANLLIQGNIPIGSGLSSSAAIEVASALALMSVGTVPPLSLPQVATLCQTAENTFIGAHVGIMDQFISCMGKAGHSLLLDCRSLDFKLIPIPTSIRLVICNTMVKHSHATGEYNRRREECNEGMKTLAKWYPGIAALRDVSPEQLQEHAEEVPETIYKRCLHVVTENRRTLNAAQSFDDGDLVRFGDLMQQSHRSLRDLYEVSCSELDLMVEIAERLTGFRGGRMTGGGFGGCTVNLVEAAAAPSFVEELAEQYHSSTGIKPDCYICTASDGARVESFVRR